MKKRKILAVILSAAMIAGLSIGSYADETPEVNFDAVVEEYYQEGEEVTVPGRAPICQKFLHIIMITLGQE